MYRLHRRPCKKIRRQGGFEGNGCRCCGSLRELTCQGTTDHQFFNFDAFTFSSGGGVAWEETTQAVITNRHYSKNWRRSLQLSQWERKCLYMIGAVTPYDGGARQHGIKANIRNRYLEQSF